MAAAFRLAYLVQRAKFIRASLPPASKLKKDKRNGYFGWVRCRTRTYALRFVWKAGTTGLCMQENIHPLGASVRAGEDSGSVVWTSVDAPSTPPPHHGASEAHLHIHWFILFRYRAEAVRPQRGRLACARNCTTSVSPYRRYVVANLRALAI